MEQQNRIPVITILLVLANIAVFIYVELHGSSQDAELMLNMGASYEPYIVEQHEYYRLFTHMFLHFGFDHLFNNMISLAVLGWSLENVLGKWRFAVIYILSGIFAGIASVVYNIQMGTESVSCGASGAIYGLMGALLVYLILRCRGRISSEIPRYLVFIALSIYSGMQDATIDNAAHIGGFVAGFLLCLILAHNRRMEADYEN